MTKNKFVLLIALILVTGLVGMLLTSCGAASFESQDEAGGDYSTSDSSSPAPEYAMTAVESLEPDIKRVDGGVGETTLRHVIRTGSIDLAVSNTRETIKEIRSIVKKADGIISSSYIYEIREGQYGASLTLRIPEKLFDAVMEQLEAFGKATNIQTGLDDVTMQYVDLESRLNNQKAQEVRLIEILEMAETVEEVLEVERELYRIRGEIEVMTAQFTYLQDQVSYATINLSLEEEENPTANISPGAFDNFGGRIMQAFIGSINFVLNAFSKVTIAFSALLPVLIVLGLPIFLIILLVRKVAKRKQAAEEKVGVKKD